MRKKLLLPVFIGAAVIGSYALLTGEEQNPSPKFVTSGPAMPTNLEVTGATEDSISVAWGPEQPGAFYPVAESKNSVTIAWGPSKDSRYSISYTITKNDVQVASGILGNTYKLTGINNKVKSFRTCVTAVNSRGQLSPPNCANWTRP